MPPKDSKEVIKVLKKDEAMLAEIAKWMYTQGHHKMYNECRGVDSENCEGIGLRSTFVGKKCRTCYLAYKKQIYASGKSSEKWADI